MDGRPVVTGMVAVGDAWACTNPSLGRGVSIGALHACVLRDAVAKEGLDDPDALVRRFDDETERVIAPYVDATLAFDGLARAHATVAAVLATPAEVFTDPALRERVLPWVGRPWLSPGPGRAELLDVLAAA